MEIFDRAFLSSFLSNFFATLIGVFFGFAGALWLERRARARTEATKKGEEKQRSFKVLQLLDTEMKQNKKLIDEIHQDVSNYYSPPKDELWRAFSDGGNCSGLTIQSC